RMTPASTSHPSLLDLAALRFGRLDPAMAAALEQHLAACPACNTTLQQVPVETLQALLASSAQGTIVGHAPATPAPARPATPATGSAPALPAAPVPVRPVNLPPTDPWTPQPAASIIPPELASHPNYRNLRLLGRGGMGAVYQAEDAFLGRPVAIKLINRALLDQPATEERFRAEMQAAARLNH